MMKEIRFARFVVQLLLSADISIVVHNSSAAKEVYPNFRSDKMENSDRVVSIFESSKTICFTRFTIDIPKNSVVVYGRMTVDAEIDRYQEKAKDISKIVNNEILRNSENARIFDEGNEIDKLAEKPIETVDKRLTHLISMGGDDRYTIRSFLTLDEDVYVLRTSGVFGKQVRQVLRENEVIASLFRGRKENEIPDEAGVCIDGAFTSQNPTFENIELGVRLEEFPDVHLSISLTRRGNYAEPQEMFLKRHTETFAEGREAGFGDWIDRLKYLRKASRQLNGWSGDEVLIKFPAWREGKEGHQFAFWSTGKPNDPFHPLVDIKLDTGVKGNTARGVPASLTDEEAVAVWDKLLNSIRVRPINAGKQKSSSYSSVETPEIREGMELHTGAVCTASGWWQSFDLDAVEPVRWIAKGELIPQVHYRKEGTWRDKLFDTQRLVPGTGVWQLMRHDERGSGGSTSISGI